MKVIDKLCVFFFKSAHKGSSVVEISTRDRGVVGSSLTGVTVLGP